MWLLGEDVAVQVAHDFPEGTGKMGRKTLTEVVGVWATGKVSAPSLSSVTAAFLGSRRWGGDVLPLLGWRFFAALGVEILSSSWRSRAIAKMG